MFSPVAFQTGAPPVRAFRRLVEQHLPRLQAHRMSLAVVAFDFDRPGLVFVVVGVVDVEDGRHHVGVYAVGVERQRGPAAVNAHAVGRDWSQGPGAWRPLLREKQGVRENVRASQKKKDINVFRRRKTKRL